MTEDDASQLTDLTAQLLMVMGRVKQFTPRGKDRTPHPGTEFAILDTIFRHGSLTVPEVAALRGVSRQSVQLIVNRLIQAGLLGQHENPDHKASKRLKLTTAGTEHHRRIQDMIHARYRNMDVNLQAGDLQAASRVLAIIAETWSEASGTGKEQE